MARDAITLHGYPDAVVTRIGHTLLQSLQGKRKPWLAGLSGLQGSGKSTLAEQLASVLTHAGIATLALSLDDFYFGRRERARLARDVHPLLATRGVPGTHDLALLDDTLDDLGHASAQHPAWVPRFDKGRDTRMPRARWNKITAPPKLILLEGWCIGVPAQTQQQLQHPLNSLEREQDSDGRWRSYVNMQLTGDYAELWQRLDALVLLQAPGFEVVRRWRDQQESTLRRAHAPYAMSPAALRRFIMHYERLSRHALRTLPTLANLRIVLDANRHVRRIATTRSGHT